jgi:dolichyl-phosphate-mannose-protein mannosyltransferase
LATIGSLGGRPFLSFWSRRCHYLNRLFLIAAFILGVLSRRPLVAALRRLLPTARGSAAKSSDGHPQPVARPAVVQAQPGSTAPEPSSSADTEISAEVRRPARRSFLSPGLTAILLAFALALVIVGQRDILAPTLSALPVASYALGLLLFAGLNELARRQSATASDDRSEDSCDGTEAYDQPDLRLLRGQRHLQMTLLAAALLLGLVTWTSMRGHDPDGSYLLTVLTWLGSLAAVVGASVAIRASSGWLGQVQNKEGSAVPLAAVVGGILIAALLARVIDLEHIPYVFGGDEGSQAMSAVAVLQGQLKNPFGTGWYSVPTLFFFLQAGSLAVVGDSATGARMVAVLMGVAAVGVTFLLARRLFGTVTGLIATLLLATFHYHVHFSRLSSNQIADSLAVVAVLYALDRSLYERRALDALLAGCAIGLSQYFSFAGRIIPLVAIAYVLLSLMEKHWIRRSRTSGQAPAVTFTLVAWIVLGAALTYAPLAAYFMDHPDEFTLRTNQVSMFSSGWLDREMQMTGRGAVELTINQIWRAVLLPFHTVPGGWYVNQRPFIGMPMAVVLAIGLTLTTFSFWKRPYRGLALAYWASAVGLGLTEDPTQTQRFVVASSLMAVLSAVAITAAGRIAQNLARYSSGVVFSAVSLSVVGLMAWNLFDYFGPRDNRLYGDTNSLIATELAYYLRPLPNGTTVYFLGPPRMSYGGFQSLAFIARSARGVDVNSPLTETTPRPTISGSTVFAALPERARELDVVRQWYPGGEAREIRERGRDPILAIYTLPAR